MLKISSFIKNEKGQALILVAISMVVLLGFSALVTDVGYLFLQKRDLQNAADSASLAAATRLPDHSQVIAMADVYAEKNNVHGIVGTSINGDEVTVTITSTLPRFLGRILSSDDYNVSVAATATKMSVWGNVKPFAPLPRNYTDILACAGSEKPLLDEEEFNRLSEKTLANVQADYNGSYQNRLEDFRSNVNIGAIIGVVAGSNKADGPNYGFLDLRENMSSSAGASDIATWLYYGAPDFQTDIEFNTSQPGNIAALFSGFNWIEYYSPIDYMMLETGGIFYMISPHPSVDMSSPGSIIQSKDYLIIKIQVDSGSYACSTSNDYRLIGEVLEVINPFTNEGQTAGFNAGIVMNKSFIIK